MTATRLTRHVKAPRAEVYRALLDPRAVATWQVPRGMRSKVHIFEPREGGAFRITLTYDSPLAVGKTTLHSDTFHGRFVELIRDERVVQSVEFETKDPAMKGEQTITYTLLEEEGGTEIYAVHDNFPPGVSPKDNETGWRMSLDNLAAYVEAKQPKPAAGR